MNILFFKPKYSGKWQGSAFSNCFCSPLKLLQSVILKGNKTEQVHANHITKKGKTSLEGHQANSDCSCYRNRHWKSPPFFSSAELMLLYHLYAIVRLYFTRPTSDLFPLSTVESIFPHVYASSVVGIEGRTINLINGEKIRSILLTRVFPQRQRKLLCWRTASAYSAVFILWLLRVCVWKGSLCLKWSTQNCTYYHKKFLYAKKIPTLCMYLLLLLLSDTSAWGKTIFVIGVE